MPIPIIARGATEGLSTIPYIFPILKATAGVSVVALLKQYFGGARNGSTRLMHSKVVMVTGGTSGVGAAVVRDLASRGAQIILLTRHAPSDPFLVDYIEDLRSSTENELIYAEQVDLSSLHSIRVFATKWVDNAPPRRLDMVILCANAMTLSSPIPQASAGSENSNPLLTEDGLNEEWQVNYLANYHLLSILSPALRAQPPDRDVRIIFSTCSGYIGAKLDFDLLKASTLIPSTQNINVVLPSSTKKKKSGNNRTQQSTSATVSNSSMYATTKLALMMFAHSFQQHLATYSRPDQQPTNTCVLVVDPGLCRTAGTRAWLTRGSLWGLLLYLITWPLWWLILKSPEQGAQSYLMAAMEAGFSAVGGVGTVATTLPPLEGEVAGEGAKIGVAGRRLLKECRQREILREEVWDEDTGKRLWEFSQGLIEKKEKEGAVRRAAEKKEEERQKNQGTDEGKEKGTKKDK